MVEAAAERGDHQQRPSAEVVEREHTGRVPHLGAHRRDPVGGTQR